MQQKLKSFKKMNYIHSLLYLLLGIIHLIMYFKIYWISKITKTIFFILVLVIFCFGVVIPLFFAAFLSISNLTKKKFKVYHLLSDVFACVFIVKGLIIFILILENFLSLPPSLDLCPLSYDIHDISNIFDNYQIRNKKEIKKRCNNRRCFFNNELKINDDYIYYYICNFHEKDILFNCIELIDTGGVSDNMINYIKYCQNYSKLYVCEKYVNLNLNKISYETVCPTNFDFIFNILFTCFTFVNIYAIPIPWFFEFNFCHELITLLSPNNNYQNQNDQNLKETNNTSKVSENSQDNKSQNFQKEPTRTIIIDNCNQVDIHQNLNNENNKNILSINNKKINVIGKALVNNNNLSQSDNNLINNNNNMLKVINYNIKSKNSNME